MTLFNCFLLFNFVWAFCFPLEAKHSLKRIMGIAHMVGLLLWKPRKAMLSFCRKFKGNDTLITLWRFCRRLNNLHNPYIGLISRKKLEPSEGSRCCRFRYLIQHGERRDGTYAWKRGLWHEMSNMTSWNTLQREQFAWGGPCQKLSERKGLCRWMVR